MGWKFSYQRLAPGWAVVLGKLSLLSEKDFVIVF